MKLARAHRCSTSPLHAPLRSVWRRTPAHVAVALAALGAASVASTPARADRAPAELRVAIELGSSDGGAAIDRERLLREVDQRLADELARPVVRVPQRECQRGCLYVILERAAVTERFQAATGEVRERTVDVGGDPALWPEAVALLAGNLVRDEAAGLLDEAPALGAELAGAPPAAPLHLTDAEAPVTTIAQVAQVTQVTATTSTLATTTTSDVAPAVTAAASPASRHVAASFGVLPVLSTDWTAVGRVRHDFSLDLLVGASAGSRVLSVAGLVDLELGVVDGVQVAGLAASAGELRGLQLGGLAAIATEVRGAQLGGLVTSAGLVRGTQVAGLAAVARRSTSAQLGGLVALSGAEADVQVGGLAAFARGPAALQLAGLVAVAGRRAGVQVAGLASVVRGTAATQISGLANVADVAHTQIAGTVNVARRLEGVQVGVVNFAGTVKGVQVGVVNVGRGDDGISVGLLNLVPGGRTEVEASVDSSAIGAVMLRHGSRRWHNVYGVGGQRVSEELGSGVDDVWMYGLGFGPSWRTPQATFDLELLAWHVSYGSRHADELSLLGQLRLSAAHAVGPVALVGGVALNTFISTDHRQPFLTRRSAAPMPVTTGDVETKTWLSVFVGVRL